MNVLSLFDGMSCGQQALERSDIKVDKYFASEIKPHAIKVTQHNYPNTIQLGDIMNIKGKDLPKIDLIIGGSPCQDFSQANKEKRGLNGEKSSLFFEFLRLIKECKPKYFLLENVKMDDYSYNKISHLLGTYPVDINSSLVSAQMRQRSYWTNIGPEKYDLFGMRYCDIPQPIDKKINLKDILTDGYTDRVKSTCILEGWSRPHNVNSIDKIKKRYDKGFTTIVFNSEDLDYNKGVRFLNQIEMERLQTVKEEYTSILSRNQAACLLGDGWTVDVISHIFNYLPKKYKQ